MKKILSTTDGRAISRTSRTWFRKRNSSIGVAILSSVMLLTAACGSTSATSKTSTSTTASSGLPFHTVTIVSYSPPGGTVDLLAREIAKEGPTYFPGVNFVVQDITGGGPAHGLDYLLSKPADGATWAVTTRSITSELATTLKSQFQLNQFNFVATQIGEPYEIAVNPSSGITTMKELIAAAQKNPNFTFGGFSSGSPQELLAYLLAQENHFKFNWVPYSGGNKAMAALLGNHIDAGSLGLAYTVQSVNAGKLRVLGISTKTSAITAPTFKSLGINNVIAESLHWTGVITKVGIPSAVNTEMASGLVKMANSPSFLAFDKKLGFVPSVESGAQLQSEATQSYAAFQSAFSK